MLQDFLRESPSSPKTRSDLTANSNFFFFLNLFIEVGLGTPLLGKTPYFGWLDVWQRSRQENEDFPSIAPLFPGINTK